MADWTEKYRPSTLSEIRGNDKACRELREWADTWSDHRTAVILHGRPGVGKTSAAHALAADRGWSVVELNASDQRTANVIERIAGEASKSGTIFEGESGRRLVVLDEADNFHGSADYGGASAVTELIKGANQPIILIANEFYEMSRSLRNNCETIEFRNVTKRSIVPVLRDICRKEGIEFESAALEAIGEQTNGDLRSAINDLQALAERTERLTVEAVITDHRDRTTGIFEFLDDLFKEADAREALTASYDIDETPDDLIRWIEDNLPSEYAGAELRRAYRALARSDEWLGRVRESQEYRYWRYASDNMTAGVAASRERQKGGWTRYGPPSYWAKLGRTRSARTKRDYIARKIAESSGISMETARRSVIPFLSVMTHHCKNRELTVQMAAKYDLEVDHVAFITGSGADTNKVNEIVEEARRSVSIDETDPNGGTEPTDSSAEEATSEEHDEGSKPEAESTHDDDARDTQSGLADFI